MYFNYLADAAKLISKLNLEYTINTKLLSTAKHFDLVFEEFPKKKINTSLTVTTNNKLKTAVYLDKEYGHFTANITQILSQTMNLSFPNTEEKLVLELMVECLNCNFSGSPILTIHSLSKVNYKQIIHRNMIKKANYAREKHENPELKRHFHFLDFLNKKIPRNTSHSKILARKIRSGSMPNSYDRCQLREFTYSFAQLGLGDVVTQPIKFDTGLCYGGCDNNLKNYMLMKVDQVFNRRTHHVTLKTCAPTLTEDLNALVKNTDGSETLEHAMFRDVKVKQCGCSPLQLK